jgi:hypothetical protein
MRDGIAQGRFYACIQAAYAHIRMLQGKAQGKKATPVALLGKRHGTD